MCCVHKLYEWCYFTLVDHKVASQLKRAGLKQIEVRSPLTCEQEKGVCQKCFGLDEHGKDASIGDNVGAKSGQAIAEPLVQLTMNTFHTGGAAGTGVNASGIARIDQLLKMPKTVAGAAKLSPFSGKVVATRPGVGGGNEVDVLDAATGQKTTIKTPQGRRLLVRAGSSLRRGDALNEGPIKPQELVTHKGMLPTQQYMVNELQKEYRNQGPNISAKTFETLVRSITDTTVVSNNPRQASYIPGDVGSYNAIRLYNKNLVADTPIEDAGDERLAEDIGKYKAGYVLKDRDVQLLKTMGYKTVKTVKDRIEHEPVLRNITTLPVLKNDWMAALGYRNLKKVITEGAAKGQSTDLHGYNPLPAYARGTEFGYGKDGKY